MRAYEVGIKHIQGTTLSTVFAETAGKAKYKRLLDYRDAGYEVSFAQLSCRALGDIPVPETVAEFAARECKAFNFAYPVGTMLRYWSGVKEGEPTGVAPISHPASVTCEHAVIWLQGVSSCHSLSHVEPAALDSERSGTVENATNDNGGKDDGR